MGHLHSLLAHKEQDKEKASWALFFERNLREEVLKSEETDKRTKDGIGHSFE